MHCSRSDRFRHLSATVWHILDQLRSKHARALPVFSAPSHLFISLPHNCTRPPTHPPVCAQINLQEGHKSIQERTKRTSRQTNTRPTQMQPQHGQPTNTTNQANTDRHRQSGNTDTSSPQLQQLVLRFRELGSVILSPFRFAEVRGDLAREHPVVGHPTNRELAAAGGALEREPPALQLEAHRSPSTI